MFEMKYKWVEAKPHLLWRILGSREWVQVSDSAMRIERTELRYVAHCFGQTHSAMTFRQARLWAEKLQKQRLANVVNHSEHIMNAIVVHCYDCGTEMALGPRINPVEFRGKLVLKCASCNPSSGIAGMVAKAFLEEDTE
jgi:hypothetical protein